MAIVPSVMRGSRSGPRPVSRVGPLPELPVRALAPASGRKIPPLHSDGKRLGEKGKSLTSLSRPAAKWRRLRRSGASRKPRSRDLLFERTTPGYNPRRKPNFSTLKEIKQLGFLIKFTLLTVRIERKRAGTQFLALWTRGSGEVREKPVLNRRPLYQGRSHGRVHRRRLRRFRSISCACVPRIFQTFFLNVPVQKTPSNTQ